MWRDDMSLTHLNAEQIPSSTTASAFRISYSIPSLAVEVLPPSHDPPPIIRKRKGFVSLELECKMELKVRVRKSDAPEMMSPRPSNSKTQTSEYHTPFAALLALLVLSTATASAFAASSILSFSNPRAASRNAATPRPRASNGDGPSV